MTSQIAPHVWFPEPKLSFHPERASDTDAHPLRGLLRFGPHSSGLVPDPIRVATIAPVGEGHRLYSFMKELNSEYDPSERKDYLPKWPGFSGVFSVHMRGAARPCQIELGHWVGHPSRLARDLSGMFGSALYAKEELVAK